MRRILTILFSFLAIGMIVAEAGEPCEVQLVTNEDYGLVLDWAIPLKSNASNYGVDVTFVKHDSEGNVYCAGSYKKALFLPNGAQLTRPDERLSIYIAKFSKEGDLVWCKDFYHTSSRSASDGSCWLDDMLDIEEGATTLSVAVSFDSWGQKSPTTFFYDGEKLTELNEETTEFNYMKLSLADGSLEKRFSMTMAEGIRSGGKNGDFWRMDNGDYLIGAYIDTGFVGFSGYESTCRSQKNWSRYILKLDSDLRVKWDYAYATEFSKEGLNNTRTQGEIFCVGDTLYNLFHYEAEDYNVNPEGEPIIVNRKNWLQPGSLILKSDVSGNQPKFLGYYHYDQDKLPVNLRSNSKGEIVASKQIYTNSLCSCVKIVGDVEVEEVNEIPFQNSSWWWTDLNPTYSFGEEDRICVLGYNAVNPLVFKFMNGADSVRFEAPHKGHNYMLSLYGRDSVFHSAITTELVYLHAMDLDDRRGCFYLGASNESNTVSSLEIPIDWDPNPNKEVYNRDSKNYVEIVKYTETFRIKSKVEGNGSVVLQDCFVKYGAGTTVKVVPDAGWRIDSVLTSRGEVLTVTNGICEINDVRDVLEVRAYFSSLTAAKDQKSNEIFLYPNPSTGKIQVVGKHDFDYEVLDMQGNVLLQGKSEGDSIDVNELPMGQYILRIEYSYHKFQKN